MIYGITRETYPPSEGIPMQTERPETTPRIEYIAQRIWHWCCSDYSREESRDMVRGSFIPNPTEDELDRADELLTWELRNMPPSPNNPF